MPVFTQSPGPDDHPVRNRRGIAVIANGDGSLTKSNLQPGSFVCTIVIDP